ncbi:lysoplasmalogenase [Photobacterium sanguinicancri]|uniref:lysoplasmalogenase n=1 Tax=Photobacterium sanguinicancri TaxID=875932 RepID=UPI00247FFAEA|nr:lysoplasmalogenase [Photobacterium sanguinicancri]MDO6499463.1 lysoplasmalogenase [Photobacterium sanguinicancri]
MWVWLAISFSALLHINAAYKGPKWQFYFFKPLTTGLLMVTLWQHGLSHFYQQAIFVGLLCSMVGDIFLMLPRDRFVQGLGSFLVAHIIYSVAFWSQLTSSMVWWLPAMLFGGGVIVFLLLLPTLGRLVIPVALYIGMITQMAWAAGEFWLTTQSLMGAFAFGGALIFMVSDSVLAIDRFRGPYHSATAIVMTTYYLAQSLIVLSALMMASA